MTRDMQREAVMHSSYVTEGIALAIAGQRASPTRFRSQELRASWHGSGMNFLDIGDISPEIVWKAQKDPEVAGSSRG